MQQEMLLSIFCCQQLYGLTPRPCQHPMFPNRGVMLLTQMASTSTRADDALSASDKDEICSAQSDTNSEQNKSLSKTSQLRHTMPEP